MAEVIDGGSVSFSILAAVVFAAMVLLAINLVLAAREVDAQRVAAPERVQLDDAATASGSTQS